MNEHEDWDRCENCDWPIPPGSMGHISVVNGFARFYCNPEPTPPPMNAPPARHIMTYEEGFIRKP